MNMENRIRSLDPSFSAFVMGEDAADRMEAINRMIVSNKVQLPLTSDDPWKAQILICDALEKHGVSEDDAMEFAFYTVGFNLIVKGVSDLKDLWPEKIGIVGMIIGPNVEKIVKRDDPYSPVMAHSMKIYKRLIFLGVDECEAIYAALACGWQHMIIASQFFARKAGRNPVTITRLPPEAVLQRKRPIH